MGDGRVLAPPLQPGERRTTRTDVPRGRMMTLDQCRGVLAGIRRRQGTRFPVVRVEADGMVHRGRIVHSDSDPDSDHDPGSPFGTITLSPLGLASSREVILQIASLSEDAMRDVQLQAPGRVASGAG